MTDMAETRPLDIGAGANGTGVHTSQDAVRRLKRRYATERRFKALGLGAVGVAVLALALLLGSIIYQGYTAFVTTNLTLQVTLDPELIDPSGKRERAELVRGDYQGVVRRGLRELLPEVTARSDLRDLYALLSVGAGDRVRELVLADPSKIGSRIMVTVPLASDFDMLNKGRIDRAGSGDQRRVNDKQIAWFDALKQRGAITTDFNTTLFTKGDSRQPELAGIGGSLIGSLLTLAVTLVLAFPLGVATAIYLEEFAPKNKWTDLIEVNINNLAAVPSIVFGLLGLAVFLQFFGMPRSAPFAGGVVLALMSLPIIIIASRAALRAVPPSIRQAAIGLGASRMQTVFHHVLPLAMPGILTGTILSMAHALGETAPLLMIGMVAFIVDIPTDFTSAATVLPVQIYIWADSPERGFEERTSAAIIVLLMFLLAMNALAIFLRKKFERKW